MSTTVPRLALSRYAPFFIRASWAAPIILCVCGVSGTCRVTKSTLRQQRVERLSPSALLPIGSFAEMS